MSIETEKYVHYMSCVRKTKLYSKIQIVIVGILLAINRVPLKVYMKCPDLLFVWMFYIDSLRRSDTTLNHKLINGLDF